MRITTVGSSRPAYYDRTPATKLSFGANLSQVPTSLTPFTYTVPTGRKFFVGAMSLNMYRQTVATTGSIIQLQFMLTPNGGAVHAFAEIHQWGNTAADNKHAEVGGGGVLVAGDVLAANYTDNSTGGTVDYSATVYGTEFDA